MTIEKLFSDDPRSKKHAAVIQQFNDSRRWDLDHYLAACSYFFEIDVARGNQCQMHDMLLFTLADLYDQEPLPNFGRWEGKTSTDSLITTIST